MEYETPYKEAEPDAVSPMRTARRSHAIASEGIVKIQVSAKVYVGALRCFRQEDHVFAEIYMVLCEL